MRSFPMFVACVLFGAITAIGHYVGLFHGLYFRLEWLDMLNHYFGSIAVGFGSFWLGQRLRLFEKNASSRAALVVAIGVVGIGSIWEMLDGMEAVLFSIPLPDGYLNDTPSDMAANVAGGLSAWLAARKRL